MRETRTSSFAGREFKFIAYDEEAVLAFPGAAETQGVASTPTQAAHSTWWSFQDENVVRERHWHPKPGDVVLDIGPAFGSYTLTAAVQGAQVYAVEPCLFCRSILKENIAANPGLASRIVVVPIGVHEKSGWFEPNTATYSLERQPGEMLEVKSVDDIVKSLGLHHIDWIKLDVEGAELGAMRGGKGTLAFFKPRVLIEEHEFKVAGIGARCQEVIDSLGLGYRCERHNHGSVNHAFYALPEHA